VFTADEIDDATLDAWLVVIPYVLMELKVLTMFEAELFPKLLIFLLLYRLAFL
jgi:hypothetical protein